MNRHKLKILVIDDSAYSRRSITRILEEIPSVEVLGYAINGEDGIQKVIALKPDLITLDLEMPKMDGFTLLRILVTRFHLPVIVVSVLSGAEQVFRALELGALDFVAKPSDSASEDLQLIKKDLQKKVSSAAAHRLLTHIHSNPESAAATTVFSSRPNTARLLSSIPAEHHFDLVAVGASTGGPPALQTILSSFAVKHPFAIVISQHMPPGFTKAFAERLNGRSKFDIKEASDGDSILPGKVLIAPGGKNLLVEYLRGVVTARVVSPSAKDRFVPSVDVMLDSCADVYRNRLAAVILTGMGNDGSRGVKSVKNHGGYVIAESEETSLVYGMPREALATGAVDSSLPLQMIAPQLLRLGGYD